MSKTDSRPGESAPAAAIEDERGTIFVVQEDVEVEHAAIRHGRVAALGISAL